MTSSATPGPIGEADARALRGARALARISAELTALEGALREAPAWRPGQGLLAEVAWCRGKVAEMAGRWEHKLVVAIVGPSGAGKSTLLNVLAGRELSPMGRTRPTTRQVVVYARHMAEAEELIRHCGSERVRVETNYQAEGLEHLLLVDTPDTNTLPENQELLARLLEKADLVLAVFPAQNPRMHDNLAFLRPYVRQLPGEAIVPVLNWADRVPQHELEGEILPDFRQALAREWELQPERVFVISAKAGLPGVSFPQDERPLHDINQLTELRKWLFTAVNRAGQVTDRRLARAEHLLSLVREDCSQALAETREACAAAEVATRELDQSAWQAATAAVPLDERTSGLEAHVALYDALGHRWWGPVGWLVTLWALVLRFSSYLGRLVWRQSLGLSLGRRVMAQIGAPSIREADRRALTEALDQLGARRWPPVADALGRAGFEAPGESDWWRDWARAQAEAVGTRYDQAYAGHLAALGRRLSSWPLQLVANLPTLTMVGWACAQTVGGFLQSRYLPGDYFRHAAVAVALVWLLSFVLLQLFVSLALRGSARRIMRTMRETAEARFPLQAQLAALRTLERRCRVGP